MEYTKSEARKAKESIEKILKSISENVPYIRIENGIDLMWWGVVQLKLKELHEELAPLKDHIIDNDDYIFANKLNDLITPVWNDYCTRANNGDFETHKEAYKVQPIISDLRKWIGEYEAEHPKQQNTPNASPSAKEEKDKTAKRIIDTESLKTLFVDLFFVDNYDIQDTHNKSIKLSRYDKFCQRLEMVLTDTDNKPTQKNIGEIAYMIYCSPFTRAEYHKPKRTGEKGHFSNLINTFFDIVGKDRPSDTRPNKYEPKDEDGMKLYFGDILKLE